MQSFFLNKIESFFYFIFDIYFDFKYGIETTFSMELSQLDIPFSSKQNGRKYQPSRSILFKNALRKLQLKEKLDFKEMVFIDVGTGKGRIALWAAKLGFKKVMGIEFSPYLYQKCQKNIEQFSKKYESNTIFEIYLGDAGELIFPDEVDIIYLFNPFDSKILSKMLTGIGENRKSLLPLYIIYMNPLREYLFDHHKNYLKLFSIEHKNHNNSVSVFLYQRKLVLN